MPQTQKGITTMKQFTKSGAALAAAAFSLALAGAVAPAQSTEAKVMCMGVNACKGQSECKTAASSCKGLNACKGQGFLGLTEAECSAAGGKNGGGINS